VIEYLGELFKTRTYIVNQLLHELARRHFDRESGGRAQQIGHVLCVACFGWFSTDDIGDHGAVVCGSTKGSLVSVRGIGRCSARMLC
jgi:hypothetical protein